MDIEQLKLVLATVQGVSGDAFKVGAIYIGAQFLKELLAYGLGGIAIFATYKAVALTVRAITAANDAVNGLKRISVAVGLRHPGMYVSSSEIDLAVATVEALARTKGQK